MGEALIPMLDEAIRRLVGEAACADELRPRMAMRLGQAAVDAMADLCGRPNMYFG